MPQTITLDAAHPSPAHTSSRVPGVLLWILQAVLAALFAFGGGMKLVMPVAALAQQSPMPGWIFRVVGVLELLGALGLVLPAALRIRAWLTPTAAAGLAILMVGATAATLGNPKTASSAPMPVVVGLLALVVAYGRRGWLVRQDAGSVTGSVAGR